MSNIKLSPFGSTAVGLVGNTVAALFFARFIGAYLMAALPQMLSYELMGVAPILAGLWAINAVKTLKDATRATREPEAKG